LPSGPAVAKGKECRVLLHFSAPGERPGGTADVPIYYLPNPVSVCLSPVEGGTAVFVQVQPMLAEGRMRTPPCEDVACLKGAVSTDRHVFGVKPYNGGRGRLSGPTGSGRRITG
jgi:hypothetical protein